MSETEDELVLKLPYARLLLPDTDGSWFATIIEFPGCFAVGDTPAEAATVLEEVAIDWLASARRQGQSIPDPLENDKHDLPTRIASLTARVSELEQALKPFADVADEYFNDWCPDDTPAWYRWADGFDTRSAVTVGDFRRARSLIPKP